MPTFFASEKGPKTDFKAFHGGIPDDQIRALIPAGVRGTTEDIAAAVCFLASDDARYVTGHSLVVDGGWRAK